jgi:hypothetical protein
MATFKKIPIDNCPETGLARAVVRKHLHIFENAGNTGQVVLECFIEHYKSDGSLAKNVKPSAKKTLATNIEQLVDPLTLSSRGRKWSKQEMDDYKQLVKDIAAFPALHDKWVTDHANWEASQHGDEPVEPIAPAAPAIVPITEFDYYYAMTQFPSTIEAEEEKLINERVKDGQFVKLDGEV